MNSKILKQELLAPGHMGCPGCGASLVMRYVLEVLGPKTMVVMPAGCWPTFVGLYPSTCLRVPVMSVPFATTAMAAAGVRASLNRQGKGDTNVLAWAGDGGTFDIGLQALSGAAEKNTDLIYVCYDNEAYMNTGIQRSSATPPGCWTTTTPASAPKVEPKKNIVEIMAAHRIPYAATASVGYPRDLMEKVEKAKGLKGTRFLHILASCPTGWRHETELTMEVARKAVECRAFPLYEVWDGVRWSLTPMVAKTPVADYLNMQGRFKGMTAPQREVFQTWVNEDWERLREKCGDNQAA
ncbi:MAG: pyruvate ferredoxin oxidoreductase [Desulfarculus sp.]|nr:pyruvate ferredoxin oxidoreductase [Desulfarculus sp.]MBV1752020.1 pyruvate ferredoxin oxidoreductase [Desulfarculus sp.]